MRTKTTFRPGQFICKFEENLLMREQFQVYLQIYINLYYFGCKKYPVCEIAYATIKCCVCMDDVQPLSSNFLDSWVEQKIYRTPCCYSDLHKQRVENFKSCADGYQGLSAVCPLCGCAIDDDGGLRMELWEASDFIFQRRQQRLNEEWRRSVADSIQPSPNFTSCKQGALHHCNSKIDTAK